MPDPNRSRVETLLDLLADEVAQRLDARREIKRAEPQVPPVPSATPAIAPEPVIQPAVEAEPMMAMPRSSHAASFLLRLAIGVFLVIVLINIPFNAQGTALARAIPSSASLVMINGLLVKETNSPDIWVYRDEKFHWITSLDAFSHFGYRWQDVHIVEPGFLNQFDQGAPIYVLLKCDASPHIYRLEAGRKRWIVDIPTFEAEGHVWKDVKFVPCDYLRRLPDGDSIPPGRGAPPPPLP